MSGVMDLQIVGCPCHGYVWICHAMSICGRLYWNSLVLSQGTLGTLNVQHTAPQKVTDDTQLNYCILS